MRREHGQSVTIGEGVRVKVVFRRGYGCCHLEIEAPGLTVQREELNPTEGGSVMTSAELREHMIAVAQEVAARTANEFGGSYAELTESDETADQFVAAIVDRVMIERSIQDIGSVDGGDGGPPVAEEHQ